MNIPTQHTGPLHFYWRTQYDFLSITPNRNLDECEEYIYLGSSESITVEFEDVTGKAIDALEEQIEAEKVASAHRVAVIQGRIESLRALEYQEAV